MSYIKDIEIELNIPVPIESIKKDDRGKYIFQELKKFEKKCFQKWGYINKINRIVSITNPKIISLNFKAHIKYLVRFTVETFHLKKNMELNVMLYNTKDIYICCIKNTPFLILLDNPTSDLEVGMEIVVNVEDFEIDTKNHKINIIATKK